jgi:hypothetical protein
MTAHVVIAVALLAALNLSMVRRRRRRPRHRTRGLSRHSLLYAVYLRSPLWRLRRRIWIAQARGRCEQCGRRWRQLTIHHLTYQRLGHERRSDVMVLCWGCHQTEHGVRRRRRRFQHSARRGIHR